MSLSFGFYINYSTISIEIKDLCLEGVEMLINSCKEYVLLKDLSPLILLSLLESMSRRNLVLFIQNSSIVRRNQRY